MAGSGGVASEGGRDSTFLQLLAKRGFQKTYVLNGHTNSLLFIWKCYEYTHDYRAPVVFGKGINWLVGNLEKCDAGEWSYYDQGAQARMRTTTRGTLSSLESFMKSPANVLNEYSGRFAAYAGQGL